MFERGQLVECVYNGKWFPANPAVRLDAYPQYRAIYRVCDAYRSHTGIAYVLLEEFPQLIRGFRVRFSAEAFRPLKDSALDVFRVHLVGIPVKAHEPAHI